MCLYNKYIGISICCACMAKREGLNLKALYLRVDTWSLSDYLFIIYYLSSIFRQIGNKNSLLGDIAYTIKPEKAIKIAK